MTPPPSKRARRDLGTVQLEVLALVDAGVSDLLDVRRAMLLHHQGPAVSRAVHQLVRRGLLVSVVPSCDGFQPGGAENKVRYVRRGAGS